MQARAHNSSPTNMVVLAKGPAKLPTMTPFCVATVTAGKRKQQRVGPEGGRAGGGAPAGFYGHGNCSQQRRVNYFRFTFLHFICARSVSIPSPCHAPPLAHPVCVIVVRHCRRRQALSKTASAHNLCNFYDYSL